MVRTSGNKYLQLVHGFVCGELPAGRAEMRWSYIIYYAYDVYSGGSETEMS